MAKPIDTKIEVTNVENINPQYSNYVQISHSPHEFIITFCYIDPAKIKKGEVPTVPAEAFTRIVISPSLIPIVINALGISLKKYNDSIKKELEKKND